jgi:PPK2 family polyphosphate:nucleotide phosphotransferase
MKLKSPWLIAPHAKVSLSKFESAVDDGLSKEAAAAAIAGQRTKLAALQEVMYAGQKRSVLIVLQGMDTAGKDGTISHIFSGINPQGCDVASFKVPTPLEARHDFLWRCHARVPAAGMITIFNRSHYEDVLYPRVHKQISHKEARRHMDEINSFERMLVDQGTVVLKFFLHISKDEQKRRLQARLNDPNKLWKFSAADLTERGFWDGYQAAYEDLLEHTSKKDAPWFVIPADHKPARNLEISKILVDALTPLKLKYPEPTVDPKTIKL